MPGRTLLQQAVPDHVRAQGGALARGRSRVRFERLQALRGESLVLQFGGAAGTLAALGDARRQVARLLAEELGLPLPDLPWHAERDRTGEHRRGVRRDGGRHREDRA